MENAKSAIIQMIDDMIERQPHRVNFMADYKKWLVEGDVIECARVCFRLQVPAEQDGLTHDLGHIRKQVLGELRGAGHHDVASLCKGWRRELKQLISSVDQAQRGEFTHYLGGIEASMSDAASATTKGAALIKLSGLTPNQTRAVFQYNMQQNGLRGAPEITRRPHGNEHLAALMS